MRLRWPNLVGLRFAGDRVQVKITTQPEGVQSVTEAVAAAGGEVTGSANGDTWLQAWIPAGVVDAIAARTMSNISAALPKRLRWRRPRGWP